MFKEVLAIFALTSASIASATTTVTSTNGPDILPLPAGQHVVFDFDSAPTEGFITGTGSIVSGSSSGVYAAPYLDETRYMTVGANLTTTLHLNTPTRSLSLYWGSMDDYNAIAFFDSMGNLISGYYGNQIPLAPADGSQGNPLNNRRVNFDFGSDRVGLITFNSSANAFEFDKVAVAGVPEPATWGLMIAGFGFVGVSVRRRKALVAA